MIQTKIFGNSLKDDNSPLLSTKLNSFGLKKYIPKFNVFNSLIENKLNLTQKRRGRRKKNLNNGKRNRANESSKIINESKVHNIYSNDNIKRRIKTLFNNYIIRLLNNFIKQRFPNFKMKFVKINKRINEDLGIEYNRNLLNKSIRDIIIDVSKRYSNKGNNKDCIKFIEQQKDNEEILNILNMTYKEFYNFYLKSTKINSLDNSFESHKEKLLVLYGKVYVDKFIENAKNFLEYFINTKKRKSKKVKEIDIITIPLEIDIKESNQNNDIDKSIISKVSVSTQTDIYDVNSKLIFFA